VVPVTADRALSSLERRVVASLQEDGRTPFVKIADSIGSTEPTVRRVVRRLIDDGTLVITAVANPRLLGLEVMAWIALRVDWSEATGIQRRMLEVPGVDYVATTAGTFQIFAEIGARDLAELSERVANIRRLPGVLSTETFVYIDLHFQEFRWAASDRGRASTPAGSRRLTEPERKLIFALRQSGRRSFRQISKDTQLAERQVRSIYERLRAENVLRVMAVLNPARMGLEMSALIGIECDPAVPTTRVADDISAIPGIDYLVITTGRYDVMAELACSDRDELEQILRTRLAVVPGVQSLEVFIYLGLDYQSERVWSAGRLSAFDGPVV
jgi:DNA-binding Lrp family transcriptional regulator